ncbi:glycine cleavage system transcriptional repressor [Microbulbifer thermotolerans]|uniref:glycine cleavage system protein R n=1 Tax=Microbulbifer thermotolerans TaxID=252514 RepID=UPI002248EBE1|nr:ACT domain-containing protein [Microbulbifer thermotolerans]MCX2779669.1 amino acid-binding protein [Microbulbifer thermotolerans]MCX2804900.1 amino acid-binding protein [Microbulbifer thermotolerans]MCX2831737.1 amino acid-binding protein [Microbulbifer thermotolerans]
MQQHLVISLISDDKPGVVEKLSAAIADNRGNWEDSRMAHLAGKFAGILRVSVPSEASQGLKDALAALADEGFKLQIEEALAVAAGPQQTLRLKLVGNDRPGIVHEIARALAARRINMEQLETGYGSTPWSGEPLFTAECMISVAGDLDLEGLRDELDEIADELGVDIDCEEVPTAV